MTELTKKVMLIYLRKNAEKIEALEAEYDINPEQVLMLTHLRTDEYSVHPDDFLYVDRGGFQFFAAY